MLCVLVFCVNFFLNFMCVCVCVFSKKDGKKSVCYVISVLREGAPSLRVCARGRTKVAAKNAAAKVILRKIKDTSN